MVAIVGPASFSEIEDAYSGSVFPGPRTFRDCETALCLFSAEWYGKQDAYWLAKNGLRVTAVDLNAGKLEAMGAVYPDGFEAVAGDVFEFAEDAFDNERRWDVVTLDPYTGLFDRCGELLPLWCELANRVVVLGHGNYRLTEPQAPKGWKLARRVKRSDFKGGVFWLVYKRD